MVLVNFHHISSCSNLKALLEFLALILIANDIMIIRIIKTEEVK